MVSDAVPCADVATTRVLSLPILLLIAAYERQTVAGAPIRRYFGRLKTRLTTSLPTKWSQRLSLLEGDYHSLSNGAARR